MSHSEPSHPETFEIRILRQDSPEEASYWERHRLEWEPDLNITSCLQRIAAKAETVEGKPVSPVCYDANCLEEVCGSCTMLINGHTRQACSALVDKLLAENPGEIELRPMSKFPVVRDLAVDRARMFDNLSRVKAWVPIDGTWSLGRGPLESPDRADVRYKLSTCMTCGCCLEACPQFTIDNEFVGAQIFGQVTYFNMHKTGKVHKDDRLEVMEEAGGIADCGNAQNCVKVCPKELPLTEAIGEVGRQTTIHAVKAFFTGK